MLFYVVLPYLILGVVGDEKYWWSAAGLPDLSATPTKALCMVLHFLCGLVITLSGMWQLWPRSRTAKWIWLHRVVDRIYVVSAVLTFIGGFGFIAQQGVLAGGLNMTVSLSIYGFLVPSFALSVISFQSYAYLASVYACRESLTQSISGMGTLCCR